MITEEEYKKLEKAYLEQRRKIEKPSGALGNWAFDIRSKNEFNKLMKKGIILNDCT